MKTQNNYTPAVGLDITYASAEKLNRLRILFGYKRGSLLHLQVWLLALPEMNEKLNGMKQVLRIEFKLCLQDCHLL